MPERHGAELTPADSQAVYEAQLRAHVVRDWFEAGVWLRDLTAALERRDRKVTLLAVRLEQEEPTLEQSFPVTFVPLPETVSVADLYGGFL